ncbi:MAG: TetR/AcrR family transcriptional regulator [Solirubrobacterales bacterium]|nr:TetR/AcrR family transcriptional regulator [Solirubrobacterales bacterium]
MARAMWLRWGDETLVRPSGSVRRAMEAGLRVFDQMGYETATIEDLRLQSEMSVGSIYHHFGDKAGLATALYVQSLLGYQERLRAVLASPHGNAETVVRGFVVEHLRWAAREPARARLLLQRREIEVAPLAQARIDATNRALFGVIDRWYGPRAERCEIRLLAQPLLHAVWMGPAQEYCRLALGPSRGWPPDGPDPLAGDELATAERDLADTAWAALRP